MLRCDLETWPSPTWPPSPPSTCQSAPSPGKSWWGCPSWTCRVIACKVGFVRTSLCKKGKKTRRKNYDDHLDLIQPGPSLLWQLDFPLFPRSLLEQVLPLMLLLLLQLLLGFQFQPQCPFFGCFFLVNCFLLLCCVLHDAFCLSAVVCLMLCASLLLFVSLCFFCALAVPCCSNPNPSL